MKDIVYYGALSCIVLLVLYEMYRKFRDYHAKPLVEPDCYGDYPANAQDRAEYCCDDCPYQTSCHKIATVRHRDV